MKRKSQPSDPGRKQKWTLNKILLSHFVLFLFFVSLSWNGKKKQTFLSFHRLLVCQAFRLEVKKKKTWLSMNQQCVSMWVDKTASSCLVRFSLSYSVGQKVMPMGFKSHWKGPSYSARYCLACKVLFFRFFLSFLLSLYFRFFLSFLLAFLCLCRFCSCGTSNFVTHLLDFMRSNYIFYA